MKTAWLSYDYTLLLFLSSQCNVLEQRDAANLRGKCLRVSDVIVARMQGNSLPWLLLHGLYTSLEKRELESRAEPRIVLIRIARYADAGKIGRESYCIVTSTFSIICIWCCAGAQHKELYAYPRDTLMACSVRPLDQNAACRRQKYRAIVLKWYVFYKLSLYCFIVS